MSRRRTDIMLNLMYDRPCISLHTKMFVNISDENDFYAFWPCSLGWKPEKWNEQQSGLNVPKQQEVRRMKLTKKNKKRKRTRNLNVIAFQRTLFVSNVNACVCVRVCGFSIFICFLNSFLIFVFFFRLCTWTHMNIIDWLFQNEKELKLNALF